MTSRYTHGAVSPSDPNQVPMKYFSLEQAQVHVDRMNALIKLWEENPDGIWNKEYWKTKPDLWVVKVL